MKQLVVGIKCKAKDLIDNLNTEQNVEYFKTNKKCNKCNHDLYKSDLKGYDYVCFNCQENFYKFEI